MTVEDKNASIPNYRTYSKIELEQALQDIDKARYPERVSEIIRCLEQKEYAPEQSEGGEDTVFAEEIYTKMSKSPLAYLVGLVIFIIMVLTYRS